MRGELGRLRGDGGVDVDDLEPPRADKLRHLGEQDERVGSFVSGVGIREERADISCTRSSEQGVRNSVREHIRIGMAGESALAGHVDAAQDERAPLEEGMDVVAVSDPHTSASPWSARTPRSVSATARSSGNVTLMLGEAGSTQRTMPPARSTRLASSVPMKSSKAAFA